MVDQLESNRQARRLREQAGVFAIEERSRTRQMWERQDDEYEYLKLQRYRGQKLAELEATMQAVIMELPDGSPLFNDEVALMEEAHKRMQAKDPSFGEHVALSHGLDPAAGSAIRDKNAPVSGFGHAPGKGAFFELDTTNGKQPYTENRTSADNDPVAFRQTGLQELVNIYGPGVMQNDLMIAARLRNLVGADQVTGNPLSTQDKQARQPTQEEPSPGGGSSKEEQITTSISSPEDERIKEERSDAYWARHGELTKSGMSATEAARTIRAERASTEQQPEATTSANKPFNRDEHARDLRETLNDSEAPASSRVAAGIQLFYSNTIGSFADTAAGAARFASQGKGVIEGTREAVDVGAGFIADVAYEVGTGKPPETQGQGIDAKGSLPSGTTLYNFFDKILGKDSGKRLETAATPVTKPVATVADINEVTGGIAPEYNRDNFTQPSETAAKTMLSTPVAGTPEAAKAGASTVLSTKGRPNLVQMYNAVGLARLKIISPEQLQRYAATGQLNEAAKRELQIVQSEGYARIFDKNTGELSAAFPISPNASDTSTDEEDFDLSVKLLEDFFRDYEGKADPGAARQAVRQLDRTRDVISNRFNNGKPIPLDQNFANEFEEGLRFQRRYKDPRSVINPGRWLDSRELGRQSGTLGYAAVKAGITSQNDFDNFAFEFGIEFGEFATNQGWSEERLLTQQLNMEDKARALTRGAEPAFSSMEKAREKVREATVEAIIERAKQQGP